MVSIQNITKNSFTSTLSHASTQNTNTSLSQSNYKNNLRTQPAVFWRPKKISQKIDVLSSETQSALDEVCLCLVKKSETIKSKNIQYYKSMEGVAAQEFDKEALEEEHHEQEGTR